MQIHALKSDLVDLKWEQYNVFVMWSWAVYKMVHYKVADQSNNPAWQSEPQRF